MSDLDGDVMVGMMADRYLRDQELGLIADRLYSERLRGFDNGQTGRQMDICDCRVAFATENPNKHTKDPCKISDYLVHSGLRYSPPPC